MFYELVICLLLIRLFVIQLSLSFPVVIICVPDDRVASLVGRKDVDIPDAGQFFDCINDRFRG